MTPPLPTNTPISINLLIASAQPNASTVDLLVPEADFTPGNTTLAAISGAGVGRKVRLNNWGEYAALRMEGDKGGPFPFPNDFFVMPAGNSLVVKVWSHPAFELDSAPLPSIIDKLLPSGSAAQREGSLATGFRSSSRANDTCFLEPNIHPGWNSHPQPEPRHSFYMTECLIAGVNYRSRATCHAAGCSIRGSQLR